MNENKETANEAAIRDLVENWARSVRTKDLSGILASHSPDILMFDVHPPIHSKGIKAYEKTWDLFFSWSTDPVVFDIDVMGVTSPLENDYLSHTQYILDLTHIIGEA